MLVLEESPWYQQIIKEREQRLIMRQLRRKFAELDPQLPERLQFLSIEQLEDLAEALLDFSQTTYLEAWLQDHQETVE